MLLSFSVSGTAEAFALPAHDGEELPAAKIAALFLFDENPIRRLLALAEFLYVIC